MTLEELCEFLQKKADEEVSRGEKLFMGIPDRWYSTHLWRCTKGHVSYRYLKSELEGAICLGCGSPVKLTFPEDKEKE